MKEKINYFKRIKNYLYNLFRDELTYNQFETIYKILSDLDKKISHMDGVLSDLDKKISHMDGVLSDVEKRNSKIPIDEIEDIRFLKRSSPIYPPIIFNTLPKSGSIFISNTISKALDIFYCTRAISYGFFPEYNILTENLIRFSKGNIIRQEHFNANPININLISKVTDKLVLHVRDPRQATLSWHHHCLKNRSNWKNIYPQSKNINYYHSEILPNNWDSLSNEEKIDWQIENYLPTLIKWLGDWKDLLEKKDLPIKILLVRYEDFIKNQKEYFSQIADFYDFDPYLLTKKNEILKSSAVHYRKGESDEWRKVYTQKQKLKCDEICSKNIMKFYKWN